MHIDPKIHAEDMKQESTRAMRLKEAIHILTIQLKRKPTAAEVHQHLTSK